MSVTLVLDTTAVLAYAQQSIAVGELVSMVDDDGDAAVVVGAIGTAHAVTEARGHGAQVATREPETMAKVLPPDWGILVV
jgi:hypothetical protein